MNPSMGLLQHLHAATNQHQHQKLKWSKRAKKVYQSLVSSENSTQCVYSSFGKMRAGYFLTQNLPLEELQL